MFGLNHAPQGAEGDSVSPRREKWVVAGLTVALAAGLLVSMYRQSDRGARLRALQARVEQLNAKQAAARQRVDDVSARHPGDPVVFQVSRQAGWLTPEEWGEWYRLQLEIESLGGKPSYEAVAGNRPAAASNDAKERHAPTLSDSGGSDDPAATAATSD